MTKAVHMKSNSHASAEFRDIYLVLLSSLKGIIINQDNVNFPDLVMNKDPASAGCAGGVFSSFPDGRGELDFTLLGR